MGTEVYLVKILSVCSQYTSIYTTLRGRLNGSCRPIQLVRLLLWTDVDYVTYTKYARWREDVKYLRDP